MFVCLYAFEGSAFKFFGYICAPCFLYKDGKKVSRLSTCYWTKIHIHCFYQSLSLFEKVKKKFQVWCFVCMSLTQFYLNKIADISRWPTMIRLIGVYTDNNNHILAFQREIILASCGWNNHSVLLTSERWLNMNIAQTGKNPLLLLIN